MIQIGQIKTMRLLVVIWIIEIHGKNLNRYDKVITSMVEATSN
ncbi:hypothetical protein ACXZ74_06540 [Streptococcus agalactiae]